MDDAGARTTMYLTVLDVLQQHERPWLPPFVAKICKRMERLGLLEQHGEQWHITDAGRTLMESRGATRH